MVSGTNAGVANPPWFDAGLVFAELTIVVGLARDGGASRLARVCRSAPAQYLGQISMSLYLAHFTVYLYATWIVKGSQPYLGFVDCDDVAGKA